MVVIDTFVGIILTKF